MGERPAKTSAESLARPASPSGPPARRARKEAGGRARTLTGRGRGRLRQACKQARAVADADGRERLDGGEWPRGENEPLSTVIARGDGVFALRGHEEERNVLGTDAPRGKVDGDALRKARTRVAAEDRTLHELRPEAARSGSLDEDALRRRTASGGDGGGRGWRESGSGAGAGGRHNEGEELSLSGVVN